VSSFSDPQFLLPPVADRLGPFPQGDFLDTVWKHTAAPTDELWIVSDERGLVPFSVRGNTIRFVGSADLVDYRSPLGEGTADLIASAIGSRAKGLRIVADSLPRPAADVVVKGLEAAGLEPTVEEHTVVAVLQLPDSFEEYLECLGKKERHETRRKRRRYEAALGEVRFDRESSPGRLFDEFVMFHRQSAGDKGGFMTGEMVAYFRDLLELDGWGIDALVDETDAMVAGGFGYQALDAYFLYNSTFDPARADLSPGVVLLSSLIELAIDHGASVFDFLKGDENYKFRLGAEPRPLYVVTAMT
jgi:CelD/BcsL family acetyltransferase involved in cellulose biosynthesis